MAEELRRDGLRMAHSDNAKPVSDHHPTNMIMRGQQLLSDARVKMDETGIYDGKIEPRRSNALRVEAIPDKGEELKPSR
ncbi:hypothetical protein PYH37_004517 [Sinorhizobium numidicum]|uniref:Uncharacterized protein n=1 Tax=Sinorhizobium numidicum TaxID=680248 RepID=A0ABY8CWC4_9HYPH|nr:hypothetical protein [Sinorhizobium numidicum]WEX76225.1 hypothetical protein PYH37_004517 [Sinorhizobium numidicum]WEX82884.1 hypothetical protein PYH38_005229 [Sinorhizobium numidicum]